MKSVNEAAKERFPDETYAGNVSGKTLQLVYSEAILSDTAKEYWFNQWQAQQPGTLQWVKPSDRLPEYGQVNVIKYMYGRVRMVDAEYCGLHNGNPMWIEEGKWERYGVIEWLEENPIPTKEEETKEQATK